MVKAQQVRAVPGVPWSCCCTTWASVRRYGKGLEKNLPMQVITLLRWIAVGMVGQRGPEAEKGEGRSKTKLMHVIRNGIVIRVRSW